MNSDLAVLAADSGALLGASGVLAPGGGFTSIQLAFASGVLSLSCNDDTDEIIVQVTKGPIDKVPPTDPQFSELVGLVIQYAWTMINSRGYEDAFQLRLVDGVRREETRQFEVAASTINLRFVSH